MNKCSYENVNKTSMKKKEITTMKKSYKIEVDCANCANKMEEAAKNTAGEGIKERKSFQYIFTILRGFFCA